MAERDEQERKKERRPRRGRQSVTVHDVARHAGFSSMTVSRVVNNKAGVADGIRLKVQESIAALNFVPSTTARNLASARSMRIGYPYTNPRASYNGELLIGALDEASRSGTQLILERSFEGRETDAVSRLIESSVNGLILPPRLARNSLVMAIVEQSALPWVTISELGLGTDRLSVVIDDFNAAQTATNLLIDLGHRDIAFVAGPSILNSVEERKRGFEAAMSVNSLAPARVQQGQYTFESGMEAGETLFLDAARPTAIIAANDDMGAGILSAAYKHGIKVPEELSIIGFDDTPICTAVWPNLSTVAAPLTEMARTAFEMLISEISARRSGASTEPDIRVFPFQLIKRGSTGPARR